ncbi:soluble scavenger receptor cysteine-rich domain-containing protein SSC5D [Ctenodactylus gundi]
MRVLACLLAALVGIQAVERLRLAGGPHGCAGRVEVWHSGRWGTVCDDGWDLRDAAVACRELGCGGALAAPVGAFFGEGAGPVWLSELACRGGEGQLGLCPHRGWKAHICSHEEDAGVVCAGQRGADSRDDTASPLDGDLWLGLSAESSPGSEEPPVMHAPRPAGSPPNGPRKKSPRPPKQTKSTRAPLLTTGVPRQERLRLVSGPHGCAGRLEVWHGGRWGTVCDDGWDLRDAAVACRELGCGGALAAPGGARFGPGSGPVWMDDVGCGGGEQALRDCPRSPWGRSNCDHSEDAGLVCTGPAPRLRLADGPHGCAGRLEVWHGGRWGSVCDDAWDLRDATVACRELGCGVALAAPGGAFFGEGAGPIILDDLRCRGNETALKFCPARPWGQHDCHHREDAGAVCDGMPLGYMLPTAPAADTNSSASGPMAPTASQAPVSSSAGGSPPSVSPMAPREPGPEAGSPQLRLVAGPSRCSGRLEVWHDGRWGTVCDDSWDLRDSAVVCRELGCGGPRQPDPAAGRFGWGAGPIWLDDVGCVGTETSLSNCPAAPWGKHNCAHNEDVGVTCTGTPGLDTISDPFSWSWLPGLGSDRDAWLPGEQATKPSTSLTPRVLEKTTTKAPGKPPKSTRKWVTKNAKRPTTQSPRMPTTQYSRGLGTQGPPELASSTTTLTTKAFPKRGFELPTRPTIEGPHRQTFHTIVKPTARTPWDWTLRTMATPSTQSPREMTSETTMEQILLTSPEWPAESPSPSPVTSTLGDAGPFRVRLADGPNRCAGRLEVWHSGRWGTVCDDNWDLRDATVACWELGCGKVRPRVGKTHYGPGTGPIWLDDMGCKGTEPSLSDCSSGGWGKHNCDHEEDVGLTCTGYTDDDDYPPWTWDPTSGEDLTKGTTVASRPGHTLSWGTTRPPGVLSPATQHLLDTGSRRKPWPSAAKTAPSTLSPASSASPEPSGPQLAPASRPQLIPDLASPWEVTSDPRDASPTAHLHSLTTPDLAVSTPDSRAIPALTLEHSSTPLPTVSKELTSDPSVPLEMTPGSGSTGGLAATASSTAAPETDGFSESYTSPSPTSTTYPTTTPNSTRTPHSPTAHPTTTPHPVTSPQPAAVPHPTTAPSPTPDPLPAVTPHPTTTSHPSPGPQPTTTPHPTLDPQSTTTPHPTPETLPIMTPHSTSTQPFTANSSTTPYPTTTSQVTMTPHPTTTPHPTLTPQHTATMSHTRTPDPTSTSVIITTKSLPVSLGTELPSATPASRVTPSLHHQLTSTEAPPTPTSQMPSPQPSPASGPSLSRPGPASSWDSVSSEDFKSPRSQNPKLTPPPAQTSHPTSEPTVTPDLHSLGQSPPAHFSLGPDPGQTLGPLGPCVSPAPPIRVMACEPPALVELVAAVRNIGGQLQRLTQLLERDQQERQALRLGLAQLVDAAQGLGQLGEAVKRLAEVVWLPSTPVPTTVSPEEERPLRGDV